MSDQQRTITTETPYVMPVPVAFSGAAGEDITVYTKAPLTGPKGTGSVEILGMTTDIPSATAIFTLNGRPIWGSDQIPLAMNFGKPGSPKPIIWLERPLTISSGERIRGDLIDVAGDGPGRLFFIGRQKGSDAPRVVLPSDEVGEPEDLVIDSAFTNTADERPSRATSPILDDHFLLYGLHTNLDNATVRLFGIDGIPWSEDPVNVWAIAGRAADALTTLRFHRPYLIPAKYKIAAEFINGAAPDVDAAGQLFLKGLRFPVSA